MGFGFGFGLAWGRLWVERVHGRLPHGDELCPPRAAHLPTQASLQVRASLEYHAARLVGERAHGRVVEGGGGHDARAWLRLGLGLALGLGLG